MSSRVAMADVGREAGVCLMTVSLVVNSNGAISSTTRRRVLAVIERLDSRPSGITPGLIAQRTGTLGLVVPDIGTPFSSARGRPRAPIKGGGYLPESCHA